MSTYVKQLKEIKHVLNHYYKQRRHLPLTTSQRFKKKKKSLIKNITKSSNIDFTSSLFKKIKSIKDCVYSQAGH